MNNNCLIGYSGFVGSNILSKSDFSFKYNSKNIRDIRNKEFDLLICSAIPSDMQLANTDSKKDLDNINKLLNVLKTVKSQKAVLISTIAIYPQPVEYDENIYSFKSDSNYGENRKLAEYEFSKIFKNCHIIRLPALFGNNLKKNFIFDIINLEPYFFTKDKFESIISIVKDDILLKYYNYNNDTKRYIFNRDKAIKDKIRNRIKDMLFSIDETALQFTNSDSLFQFYNLNNLYDDILKAVNNNINILNICSEPISAKELMKNIFDKDFNSNRAKLYNYNMKSIHALKWNNHKEYLYDKNNIYSDLKEFFIKNGVL